MAEGHAVIRWARALEPLVGQPLLEVQMAKRWGERPQELLGQHITAVVTHGKLHLLEFSNNDTILCHAMQYGSWQVGAPGMELRKEERFIRLRLRTAAHEAVFYHGPVVELLSPQERAQNQRLQAIGPDVMAADFDRDEAWRRLQEHGEMELGAAVLHQHIMAGIGNIYKCEGLFLAGIAPQLLAGNATRAQLEAFWDAVIPLMWQGTHNYGPTNTLPADMQTQTGERCWVYRRSKRPCFKCGTTIRMIQQGIHKRRTFFCPTCQSLEVARVAA